MTYAAAGLALAVASLAACTGSDPAPAQTSAQVPSTTTSTTTSTPPATATTNAGPAFPAGLPDAAKTKDKAGAEAFAKYFVAQVNRSWRIPDPSPIEALCVPSVPSCDNLAQTARDLKKASARWREDAIEVQRATTLSASSVEARVDATIHQRPGVIVGTDGKVRGQKTEKVFRNIFQLAWTDRGWMVSDIGGVQTK
ncbi:DUF6318 family protein [Intrasporangium flavum]|uniref:DUF6318 family protein n=1 Tax=Intrasporangium flavum TaxID=1428657 RepID=UPI001A96AA22|nr:DUF6318 family protein [Intrasporangium flavum]